MKKFLGISLLISVLFAANLAAMDISFIHVSRIPQGFKPGDEWIPELGMRSRIVRFGWNAV